MATQHQEIDGIKARRFIRRWRELSRLQTKVDFETAGLAHEVRQEFPGGGSGDMQFRTWCVSHMEIHGATAGLLCRAARAFVLFPEEPAWHDLGGWASMGFLLTFGKKDRRRIYKAARKLVEERERPTSYTTVRNIAFTLGCRQNRTTGRPNRLKVEENLGTLRAYVEKLHGQYDLGKIPAGVRVAMSETVLARLARATRG